MEIELIYVELQEHRHPFFFLHETVLVTPAVINGVLVFTQLSMPGPSGLHWGRGGGLWGKTSSPAPMPLAAASYQWFWDSSLLGNCPGPGSSPNGKCHWFAFPQHTSDVCLSIPYILQARGT